MRDLYNLNFYVIVSLILCLCITSCKKEKITSDPKSLAIKLETIGMEDNKYRQHHGEMKERHGLNSPELKALMIKQAKIDSANIKTVIDIIKELGAYPGKSLVGIEASKTAFFVLQHAPLEIRINYLEMILEAAENNELSRRNAAMFHDQCLADQGKPQLYGTFIKSGNYINPTTGYEYDTTFLWQIKDTFNIDAVRKSKGLISLEKYLNGYGISRWD